jgi:glycosyltransferase involved in cell wall biosynthesis
VARPITIGIPFYNAEAFLADAIRSIFAQTYQDWELLLVDDGSTDRSLDIAHSVRDPRVRVISDGQNKRLPYRLNQISAEARYDLIGRMDADDVISPARFEKQVAILEDHPEIDLVTTGICSITNDKRPVGTRCGSPDDLITGRNLVLGRHAICHAAILGRKSWFLRHRYDPSLDGGDYELWIRAFSQNDLNIYVMSEPLYYYREEDSITVQKLLVQYAIQRQTYRQYGRLWFDIWEIPLLAAKSHVKALVVRMLSASGKMNLLLTRRNNSIDDENMLQHFHREIELVSHTIVPGIDTLNLARPQ